MKLYVVQVTHTDGTATGATVPALVTENPAVALTAAFGAEEAGYRFFAYTGDVSVFRVETEKMYPFESRTGFGPYRPGTCVFARFRNPRIASGWQEFWYDKDLERTYRSVFKSLTA